jgi:hypothetical protein
MRISGYTRAPRDDVRNATIRNALQICALEERIQDYRNKWHNHILGIDSLRPTQTLRTTNQTDEELLDVEEDDGKIEFETELVNGSLL